MFSGGWLTENRSAARLKPNSSATATKRRIRLSSTPYSDLSGKGIYTEFL
jgi:hypothetical protein